jgi:hypothetical protein
MMKSMTKGAAAAPSPLVVRISKATLKKKKSIKVKRMLVTKKRQIIKSDYSIIASNKYSNVSYNRVTGRWQAWTK